MALSIGLILVVLAFLAAPGSYDGPSNSPYAQVLSNMKQLHLATQQMALDGVTAGDSNLGWPGDTGGSFSNWTTALVEKGYLGTNDLCKLLSAPGKVVRPGRIPTDMKDSAVLVYAVKKDFPTNAVFLTTANFTYTPQGGVLDAKTRLFGNRIFVVFRKGGDGGLYLSKFVGDTNRIGSYVPLCR